MIHRFERFSGDVAEATPLSMQKSMQVSSRQVIVGAASAGEQRICNCGASGFSRGSYCSFKTFFPKGSDVRRIRGAGCGHSELRTIRTEATRRAAKTSAGSRRSGAEQAEQLYGGGRFCGTTRNVFGGKHDAKLMLKAGDTGALTPSLFLSDSTN